MGEVRRDDGKRNMFWRSARSWPPRHPSTMRGGASRLPKVPDRRRLGLEEGAIRRMQAQGSPLFRRALCAHGHRFS
jgi:hypothetical protein